MASRALQQLRRLDKSSPEFHNQLNSVLSSDAYQQSVQTLQGNELVSLVDYFDKVCLPTPSAALRSSQCRLLMVSIRLVPATRNVWASSRTYQPRDWYSQPHALFLLRF